MRSFADSCVLGCCVSLWCVPCEPLTHGVVLCVCVGALRVALNYTGELLDEELGATNELITGYDMLAR